MGAITRGFANRVKAGGAGSRVLLNTTTVSSDVTAINFDNTLVTNAFNTYCILIDLHYQNHCLFPSILLKYNMY